MTQSAAINEELIRKTIEFHGHSCPGVAIGIRAVELATAEFGRVPDKDFIAVVETDNCPADAIQFLTDCTFGKGNLVHRDYGKNAFTFYSRKDGKEIRVISMPEFFKDQDNELMALRKKMAQNQLKPEEEKRLNEAMTDQIKQIIEADLDQLFEIKQAREPIPEKSRMMDNLKCDACGEAVKESHTRKSNHKTLCIPCFEDLEKEQ